jgi:hypothetical protein
VANTIIIKQSSTPSNVPTAGELVQGELAINTADQILYSKTATTVFRVGVYDNVAETISSNWTFTGITKLSRSAGGEMLLLTDTGGAGVVANPFIGFDDSGAVRQGYVGFGNTGNADLYINADIGDIRLIAGGGQIRLQDQTIVTGNITATNLSGTNTGNNAVNTLYSGLVSNATHTGHVTGSTALTVVVAAITGQTDIGANLVGTDEFIVSDAGTIRRADISRLNNYLNGALSFASSGHTHSAFDRASSVLSGANVFSNIVVTDGIVTAIATRSFGAANLATGSLANGVNSYYGSSAGNFNYKIPFINSTVHTAGNASILRDSSATFTYNPSTNTMVVSNVSMADGVLQRPYIDDYALFRTTLTATASTTLNYSTAQVYAITMNASITTLNILNEPASGRYGEMTLKLIYNSATTRTIDWSDIGVKWGDPGEPTLTSVSGKHDVIHLWTDDAGASWYGSYILNY